MIVQFTSDPNSPEGFIGRKLIEETGILPPIEGVIVCEISETSPPIIPTEETVIGYFLSHDPVGLCLKRRKELEYCALIIAPSKWIEYHLRMNGFNNVETIHQGVDTAHFLPAAPRRRDGRCIVYSGGLFCYRNSSDIIIDVMRQFMAQHPECWFACQWDIDVHGIQSFPSSHYLSAQNEVLFDLEELLVRQGLPGERLIIFPPEKDPAALRRTYEQSDIGLFIPRGEYGINPALCEYLSCGKTAVVSSRTGQADSAYHRQAHQVCEYEPLVHPGQLTTWFEPTQEGVYEQLERAFVDITGNTSRTDQGLCSKAGVSWEHTAQQFYKYAEQLSNGTPVSSTTRKARGVALLEAEQYSLAEQEFNAALSIAPMDHETYNCLGNLMDKQDRHALALFYFEKALLINPQFSIAWFNKANTLKRMERFDEAIEAYQKAIACDPSFILGWLNLAITCSSQGDDRLAEDYYRKTIARDPDQSDALHLLGDLYTKQQRYDEAMECYHKAVKVAPDQFITYNSMGVLCLTTGMNDLASEYLNMALRIKPDMIPALTNIGTAYREMQQTEQAVRYLRRAITLDPDDADAHGNLSQALLSQGDYEEGWHEYEWRFKKSEPVEERHLDLIKWDGSSLAGKTLLLYTEQGYGDSIQFIRYVPMIAANGGRIVVECQDANIQSLIAGIPGVDGTVLRDTNRSVEYDYCFPLLSLPLLFGTTLETIPAASGYIVPDQERKRIWKQVIASQASGTLKIGLVWGGRKTKRNEDRSLTLDQLIPLLRIPDVDFFSLQMGADAEQLQDLPSDIAIHDLGSKLNDFNDSAAALSCMDLVITIDTSLAHLAGALGIPTWILLKFSADWRWMFRRYDSPWYLSVRLYRQLSPGNWAPVIDTICKELQSHQKNAKVHVI